ncbi:MAG: hypothetical protein M9958_07575 [Chitinophagales bacterium]|nr:hypothetical protein [Chitinophagales bacterium]
MIKRFILFIQIFFWGLSTLTAQTKLTWKILEGIGYQEKYVTKLEENFKFPVFTSFIKSLEGKQVEVQGYLIPFDPTGKEIALSANPYAACFFCGKAGPASVMILHMKTPNTKVKTDNYKIIRGVLKLNSNDPEEFYYIIENAIIVD